jgi:hypothetical protein
MNKRHLWIAILVLALLALSCQALLPEETPIQPQLPTSELIRDPVTDADRATAQALAQAKPAIQDLRELAIRLKGVSADTPEVACTTAPDYPVGTIRTFSVQNDTTLETFDVKATMRYKNKVVYMWVADTVKADDAKIKQAADYFADKIYPTDRGLLGSEASPGIDCDSRISILNTPGMGGAAGYVAGKDEVTKTVRPDSNEMKMFYMNTDALTIGSTGYLATAAHEFQHVIAENTHENLDTWVNEGLSELVIYVNGFSAASHAQPFLIAPGTQLNAWDKLERSAPHYAASFLFMTYSYNRFGADAVRTLVADPHNGLTEFDDTLATFGKPGTTADDLFADWQIANYLNDPKVGDGQFAYKGLQFGKPRVERTISQFPFTQTGSVNHWASQYFVLRGSRDVKVSFTGATEARLISTDPPDGKMMWYSGQGDDSDFTLTREFDLSGVQSATLNFSTWYNIEKDWDYFYVEASTEGGKTWKILKAPGSTDTNPGGNNYGWALTGSSGDKKEAKWVEKSVDLSEFAGKKIQLRFEYITDDALNYDGVALQDIRIPEINYTYNTDSGDGGWQAQGFVRISNREPDKYSVQLISFWSDGKTQVKQLTLAEDQTGLWDVPLSQLKNAVLVLSALARTTREPAPYQLRISD